MWKRLTQQTAAASASAPLGKRVRICLDTPNLRCVRPPSSSPSSLSVPLNAPHHQLPSLLAYPLSTEVENTTGSDRQTLIYLNASKSCGHIIPRRRQEACRRQRAGGRRAPNKNEMEQAVAILPLNNAAQ